MQPGATIGWARRHGQRPRCARNLIAYLRTRSLLPPPHRTTPNYIIQCSSVCYVLLRERMCAISSGLHVYVKQSSQSGDAEYTVVRWYSRICFLSSCQLLSKLDHCEKNSITNTEDVAFDFDFFRVSAPW